MQIADIVERLLEAGEYGVADLVLGTEEQIEYGALIVRTAL